MHDKPDFELLPGWLLAPIMLAIAFIAWVTGKRFVDVEDEGRTWLDT